MPIRKRKKSLSGGIVINLIATFILRAIGLITAPITTRLLETSDYGAMTIFSTWVGIVVIVFGLQAYGTFNNARVKFDTEEEYFHYCWNSLILSLGGHLAGLLLILPWINGLSGLIGLTPFLILLMIAQSFLQNCISMLSGHFLIENKAGWNLVLSAFVALGSFGLSVLLVKQPAFRETPYMAFIIGHFIPTAVTGIAAAVWFGIRGISRIRTDYFKYCLGLSLPLIFHGLSGVVLGQSDRIMLERIVGLSEAGVYSLTYSYSSILLTIWGAVNSIWVPFYFRYLKEKDYSGLKHHMLNFDVLFTVVYGGFLLLSPEVFHLMDSRYWVQMNLIPVLVAGFYFNHLYGYPANYEFFKEKTTYLAAASVGSAVLNILLNFLLIPRYHAAGAAAATTLSYILSYLFHAFAARVLVKGFPFSLRLDLWRLIPAALVTGVYYLLQDVAWARWTLGILIGCAYLARMIKKREIL